MSAKRIVTALLAMGACLMAASPAPAAEPAPAWRLDVFPMPASFTPSAKGTLANGPMYMLVATNSGGAQTSGQVTISDTLPAGIVPTLISQRSYDPAAPEPSCTIVAQTVTCTDAGPVRPGFALGARIIVDVEAGAPPSVLNEASVEGGGALKVTTTTPTPVKTTPVPFGFLPGAAGLSAPLFEADGAAATQAGSHPHALSANLGFPTEAPNGTLIGAGHLRDAFTELPRGEIANPAATPVLCTEAELTTSNAPGCPPASQVGTATVITVSVTPEANTVPLYNMVPPPGKASSFGFDALGTGIFAHVFGSVRSDGDYGLSGGSTDILALAGNPVFGVRIDLWGDPTSPSHDGQRGSCGFSLAVPKSCPIEAQQTALLSLPGECTGKPSVTRATAHSWEEPNVTKSASYESADLAGNPVSISGCNQLEFKPSFESRPTTNVADSPSGLDFNLHQPQNMDLGGLATAALKDAVVTLPKGMVVNPSQADGLEACSAAQIGMTGKNPARFDKSPDTCPDASKLGTLQVKTPLLAETDEAGTKILRDPEGHVLPRPLEGTVYLAKPFENPFDSLIAIYLVVDDPQSGTIAKLAGRVEPDPVSGQLKTRFVENPQLPLEDVSLHLFGGARGPLITPIACATHTTTSTLTPWSSPEGADAHPSDSFKTTSGPGGGSCPASEAQAPNGPTFSAGTIAPQAGAYSPFVLKLSRNDGSQRLAEIDATLPPGLAAKFAGVSQCSDAQIAQAQARSHPNQGILEKQSPSCPASSQVGTVNVSAGAGPTPFNTQGTAYLAGPYKGAPLSMVIVTPAVAGPFDLGAVVVRTALYVDPQTAQGHAVSDPLPTILEGIPLDVRLIAVKLDRPDFTLNPTSCDPMSILGSATSTLGGAAALSNPFQVGGCSQLPFKPKLSLKLKGGTKRASHPKLIATLKAKPGEANIASAQVKLPRSAFLDQAHIRTICTRVQFAADTCPKGSVYGKASAATPLLDDPLSGNVYLRSSNHKLPDLVVALKGPASLPIEIELAGKTDSVKGALRNTFEAVPDAPVTSFRLELFGGKRGLVVNSRDLCKHPYKAEANLDGQNGKTYDTTPLVGNDCGKGRKPGKHGHRR